MKQLIDKWWTLTLPLIIMQYSSKNIQVSEAESHYSVLHTILFY